MNKIKFFIVFIHVVFFTNGAFSQSSSSYLIANSAMNFFDYEKANNYFNKTNIKDFNISDIEKKLIASVNTDNILKSSKIAERLIKNDIKNQEAWLVYLIYSKLNNLTKPFEKFVKTNAIEKLELINYIFYDYDNKLKTNKDIANTIFEIVNSSSENDNDNFQNYDYLIFYLNLSLVLDSNYDEANYYLGVLYERLKKYKKAEEYFFKVKDNQTLYFESQKKIATNIKFYKSINESEKYFNKILKLYPENISLNLGLADFYRVSREYKKAISFYSKVINKNPEEVSSIVLELLLRCYFFTLATMTTRVMMTNGKKYICYSSYSLRLIGFKIEFS